MKREWTIFLTAVMFYTRIPCPNIDHQPEYLNKASRYFPLIGWIVGGISYLAFAGAMLLFNSHIAVLFALLMGIWTTGAFHEDGLADACDGFGGGWTKEKILTIMKDSRVGTYGAVGLIFLLLIKFYALHSLWEIHPNLGWVHLMLFITYHALARLTAINLVFGMEYAREDATSKVKPIAKTHGTAEIVGAYIFGLVPFAYYAGSFWQHIFALIPLIGLYFYAKYYFNKWLDGYTGDCLGAVEQIAECLILLSFLAIWKLL